MSHAHVHPNEHATSVPAEYDQQLTSDRDDLKSLWNCYREFMHHFSGEAVAVAIFLVGALRVAVGDFTYRDILTLVIVIAIQPFVEWFIHTYLLHLKPFEFRGKKIDLYTAKAHRRHHRAPSIIDQTLLHPQEILGSMFLISITSAPIIALLVALPTGGAILPVYLASLFWNYVGLYRYEWSHFLIHTPYVPKTRFFRSIWRNHRLHHFKHEDYWMGVTSNFGDRMLKTFPDQKTIKKSPTARTLGVETEAYDKPAA
jgi:hypothetical protein